jgi:two-component system chemotaxis sensor kinase CheA
MELDREQFISIFLLEAEEQLVAAEDAAIALESRPDDAELVQALFRAVHTLKGNADSLGFAEITGLAHATEDLLDDVRGGRLLVAPWLITLLLEAVDTLRAAVLGIRDTGREEGRALQALTQQLQVERARRRGADTAKDGAMPGHAVSDGAAPGAVRRSLTQRVEVDRLDAALGLSGELAVALERLKGLLPPAMPIVVADACQALERLQRELQDQIIALRTAPVGPMLRGFIRTVRDVAAAHGKQARLVVEGAEVTVDLNVIEPLRAPMTHLLRNAIDHGIERPDERRAAGKDPCGRITARARREADAVVLQIEDDGAGLSLRRITERARTLGLLGPAERVRDEALLALLFTPGFSTAEHVTDLSGRGVGLDAVKKVAESLRGTVSITSRPGLGTCVSIRVPISLSLLDGFSVGMAEEVYVLPRDAVREFLALPAGLPPDGPGLLDVRGRALPFVRLRELFACPQRPQQPEQSLVVLHNDGQQLGLAVDHLYGETRAVIAPMDAVFRGARPLAGYTTLGSGRIALLLDIAEIFQAARGAHIPRRQSARAERPCP